MTLASLQLCVCLCTHNPAPEPLAWVLEALRAQTLPPARWRLLVVDNASAPALEGRLPLDGLPGARIVREERLGLTAARLRAIAQADAPALVFLDDDTIPAADYLERAAAHLAREPSVGVAGAQLEGRFEKPPPRWARRFLPYLALGGGRQPRCGGSPDRYEPWYPRGAGMVVRRDLACRWAGEVEADPRRQALGRRGQALSGSEDIDLVLTVLAAGLQAAYWPDLRLTHWIPARRLEFAYLAPLVYESQRSLQALLRTRGLRPRRRPWPLEYLSGWAQCLVEGDWHPRTLAIQTRVARARYAG